MKVAGKVIIVTGGANGIGRALCERLHREGAAGIAVVDLDTEGTREVASRIGGLPFTADVGDEADIRRVVAGTEAAYGPVDLFCSNAGVAIPNPDFRNAASAPDAAWTKAWQVNVMAHVYAARAVLPGMIARRRGYFLNTVSAAGLLSQIGSAVYSTTKHAAIGFAETLAITHRDDGIGVSALCPQAVDTALAPDAGCPIAMDGVLTPDQVADAAIEGLDREAFLILPHPQVATYMSRKTADYDRWLKGMARLQAASQLST